MKCCKNHTLQGRIGRMDGWTYGSGLFSVGRMLMLEGRSASRILWPDIKLCKLTTEDYGTTDTSSDLQDHWLHVILLLKHIKSMHTSALEPDRDCSAHIFWVSCLYHNIRRTELLSDDRSRTAAKLYVSLIFGTLMQSNLTYKYDYAENVTMILLLLLFTFIHTYIL